jgi:hypothetical protein
MLRFYTWFLPFFLSIATFALLVDREYFINRPARSILIIIVILILPALVHILFRSFGSFSKAFRLLTFRILKARVFALFGVVVLAISLICVLLGLIRGWQIQTVLLGSFVIVNIVLFYLLALVWNGNFQIHEPKDFLFRCQNHPEVYLYVNGMGRHIPDPPTLFLLGWSFSDVVVLGENEFGAFSIDRPLESVSTARLVSPNDNENEVWMILEDERRLIPDPRIVTWIQNLNPQRTKDTIPRERLLTWREGEPLAAVIFQS